MTWESFSEAQRRFGFFFCSKAAQLGMGSVGRQESYDTERVTVQSLVLINLGTYIGVIIFCRENRRKGLAVAFMIYCI